METIENNPGLWPLQALRPRADGHKYDRGHVVVFGGARLTGAARLAAQAAMRTGAGLCTVVAPAAAVTVYRSDAPHIMVEERAADITAHLSDPRRNAVIIGPGLEGDGVRADVLAVLAAGCPVVLDAGGLTAFAGVENDLFTALHPDCVLTPHEGEFARLFGPLPDDRVQGAQDAAMRAGCTILLKGAETVIAAPGRTPVVNRHATPYLATAGAGDVLAGIIGGLLAQGAGAFDAACAAAWIQGEAARRFGPGLVAPDLVAGIPAVLKDLT